MNQPADLAEATAEANYAELALEGARTVEGQRRDQAERLWDEWIEAMDESTAPIGAAIEAISNGVNKLVEAVRAHSTEWQRYATLGQSSATRAVGR